MPQLSFNCVRIKRRWFSFGLPRFSKLAGKCLWTSVYFSKENLEKGEPPSGQTLGHSITTPLQTGHAENISDFSVLQGVLQSLQCVNFWKQTCERKTWIPVTVCVSLRRSISCNFTCLTLKTLTSLNKEVRPFFLGDNSIWSYPSVSFLSDYSIWRSWRLF